VHRRRRLAPLLTAAIALAACSGRSSSPPAATFEPRAIVDATNAEAAARTGFRAAFDVLAVARIAAIHLSAPPPPPPTSGSPSLRSQTLFGPEGGELLLTWDDRDASGGYTTGDVFTMSFEGYGELGLVLDGLAVFENLAIQADPVLGVYWSIRGDLRFFNLDVGSSLGTDPERLNGTLHLDRESRAFTTLTGIRMVDDFVWRGSRILAGSTMRHDDYRNLACAWFADGVVDAPELGGELAFATKYPLTGYSFFALPFLGPAHGVFEVFAASGAVVQVVPVDDFASLTVEFDVEGDDEPAITIATTWFEFLGG
jgi:hypothetical protein